MRIKEIDYTVVRIRDCQHYGKLCDTPNNLTTKYNIMRVIQAFACLGLDDVEAFYLDQKSIECDNPIEAQTLLNLTDAAILNEWEREHE